MIDISIRPMTLDDIPIIEKVQLAGFGPEFIEPMELFEGILQAYNKASFIAELNGRGVGYTMAHPSTEGRDDYEQGCPPLTGQEDVMYLHDMCVDPEVQGKGIASKLFNHLSDASKNLGFDTMIGIAVQGADSYWKKIGFQILGPYQYMGEPGLYMRKTL